MKIFITGGAGFIGSLVAKSLIERGDQVTVFDDFNDFLYPAALKQARVKDLLQGKANVIKGSILNIHELDLALQHSGAHIVLHFAAHANPGESIGQAKLYTENNVVGTLNVLKSLQENKIPRLIFAGSSSVYDDRQTPFKEESYPLRPHSPYSASKAAGEIYCSLWHELYGLPVTVLRFFSVYGPWGRPDMAPFLFAEKIILGKTIELTKDERQRDFTYIDDVVAGVLAAIDTELSFEIINIGRGEPISLRGYIAALEAAVGRKAKIIERPTPPGEMAVTFADISKARKLLQYNPKISVDEGSQHLIRWMNNIYLKN